MEENHGPVLISCDIKHYLLATKDEQKKVIQKHGEKINYDILSEMDVLFRGIKEALRLSPSVNHADESLT